jgi:peptide/nickel transport system permease protein
MVSSWYGKMFKSWSARLSFGFISLVILVSLGGFLVRPDRSIHANDQQLTIALQKPGFSVKTVQFRFKQEEPLWRAWWNGGYAHVAQWLPIQDIETTADSVRVTPFEQGSEKLVIAKKDLEVKDGNYVSEKQFILGTDKYGRDVFSRLMAGASISIFVGFIAVIISLLIGLPMGLLAGYFRGYTDSGIQYIVQVVWSIPTLLFVLAICVALGNNLWVVFLGVGLTMWVEVSRVTRGQVLSIREKEYIAAAQVAGIPTWRILIRHILPNVSAPVIVMSASNFSSAILIEAGLSFLGLGVQMPQPSWGNMIRESYAYISTDMAYLAIIPGICIMLLVLSFMVMGNALRDSLDVHSHTQL